MKRQAPLTKFFGRAAEPQQKKRTEEAQGKLFTNRVKTRNLKVTVLRLLAICAQNQGNYVSGDLKNQNFLGGHAPRPP